MSLSFLKTILAGQSPFNYAKTSELVGGRIEKFHFNCNGDVGLRCVCEKEVHVMPPV